MSQVHATDETWKRFEWSVRALAQESATQRTLYPSFTCAADELALEFDEYLRGIADDLEALPRSAVELIHALDEQLTLMSGESRAALWTDEGLRSAPEWVAIRAAAKAVLNAMGWSHLAPPAERGAVYVGPDA